MAFDAGKTKGANATSPVPTTAGQQAHHPAADETAAVRPANTKMIAGNYETPNIQNKAAVPHGLLTTTESFLQRKCATCEKEESIQRQSTTTEPDREQEAPAKDMAQLPPEPDFLSLRSPFFARNVPFLWEPSSALGVWQYNFDFFQRFGLNPNWAGKAANFTTPLFIDAQLKADNPKWWEITDQQLNTTTFMGTLPAFGFDADFRNWKPLPFLQKKSENAATINPLQATD